MKSQRIASCNTIYGYATIRFSLKTNVLDDIDIEVCVQVAVQVPKDEGRRARIRDVVGWKRFRGTLYFFDFDRHVARNRLRFQLNEGYIDLFDWCTIVFFHLFNIALTPKDTRWTVREQFCIALNEILRVSEVSVGFLWSFVSKKEWHFKRSTHTSRIGHWLRKTLFFGIRSAYDGNDTEGHRFVTCL